jgi:hypothetical protein
VAITISTDIKIYEPEFQSGMYESVAQFISGVSAASAGAIQMSSAMLPGHYRKEAFWDIASLITRRVTTSVSAKTDGNLTQDEFVTVKLNRKAGPVATTLDTFRKSGKGIAEFSYILGQQYAEQKLQNMLNAGLASVETAIEAASTTLNYTPGATLITGHLVSGMAKMGDRASSIRAWVMHSKPYFDLMASQITDKIYGNANLVVYGGAPASLGKPVIVTDSAALWDLNASLTDTYNVLGLTEGALTIQESEEESVVLDTVTGLESLAVRFQAEFAFNVGVKGYRWDVGNGGTNPTDAALATTTNWDNALTSLKNGPGVRVVVQ